MNCIPKVVDASSMVADRHFTRQKRLRAYWQVMLMSAREDRANPMRLAGSLALGVVRMILLAAIYKVAYNATHSHSAAPYANVLWSIALYFTFIIGLSVRNVFKLVEQEVKSGVVEVSLIKPLDYRAVKVCQQLGKNLLESALLMITFAITLWILVGLPSVSYVTPWFVAGYILLMILGVVAASATFLTVGLVAFWLNDSQSVFRIVDRMIMVFGGAFVPIALLPDGVQTALRFSPLGIFAASTQFFNPGLVKHMVPTIISGIVWSVLLLLLCQWVWKRAEQRIEVNGG
jgi:ABC-2 type transport system permease protein